MGTLGVDSESAASLALNGTGKARAREPVQTPTQFIPKG